ncbi:MAG: type II secretion system protein [Bacilli bacterium]|nr:type II secretion system protein [Bacilli bacterium]
MNRKGFTLVELLAVIILLTLLGVFTVVTILDKTDEKKSQIDVATETLLKTAAQEYVQSHSDLYQKRLGNIYCLSIEEILTAEEINNINANNDQPITQSKTKVKVTILKESIKYDVVNECQTVAKKNASTPLLASNMIPIKWDANNNIVMPDTAKEGDWYNYEEGRWANALIVPQVLLSKFKSLKPGELIIPFNEIVDEVIFVVWIPSFVAEKSDDTFNINFTTTNPHSAFTNSSGFWVSKFELTTLNKNVTSSGNSLNSSYSQKAYTGSFNAITTAIASLYSSSYNFIATEVDLRMIENREWAAINFLAHSSLGLRNEKILTADLYTGTVARFSIKEIKNTVSYKASQLSYGIDSSANYTSEIYYSDNSVFSSSNRNVTGVYDLNGGNNEWVISKYLNNSSQMYDSLNASSLDEAMTATAGLYDSYIGSFDSSLCLSRGGGVSNNGEFAFESQNCSKNNTTRLIIKVK